MEEYDSILKEEKKYVEPVVKKKKKRFPWFQIDIFLILMILFVSYFIYYRTVLAPDKVFFNDLSNVFKEYCDIFEAIRVNGLGSDYYLEGTLLLDDEEYNYGIIRNEDKLKIDLSKMNHYLLYYLESDKEYVRLSEFGENYILLDRNSYFNLLHNLRNSFYNSITSSQYIKKFYFDGYTPIVEVNLVLQNENLEKLFGKVQEKYEVICTFKNNAFTDEIISMKVVMNQLDTNRRFVFNYQDGIITYSDDDKVDLRFQLSKKKEDFTLKIYRGETLYSVLSGIKKEDSYQYVYQAIDQIYNLSLDVKKEDTGYLYLFQSNIDRDGVLEKEEVKLTLREQERVILDDDALVGVLDDSKFTEEEKKQYQVALQEMVGSLREFMDKYKNDVYQVDE